jgi:CheY-like chemotaxis protein
MRDKAMKDAGDVVLLIADSQIDALSGLRKSLERVAPGCRVICAEGGRSAIDCAKTTVPDAVLADMRLSDMSGLGLLLKIKAKHSDIITIMMSDCGSQEARRMCLQAGVDFFFEKPLDVNRLIGMLGTTAADEECVFRGTLDNLSVPDVLQLIICRPSTMLMEVDGAKGHGTIEIENGQVIHARANGLVGEEAFYQLVSWNEGCFEVTDQTSADERTIALPLPQLLLTAADRSESDQRLHQASEAVQESYAPFFALEETAHEASYVWAPMANYVRPPSSRPKRNAHSANWSGTVKVPRLNAFRFHPDKSTPLRVRKYEPPRTWSDPRPPCRTESTKADQRRRPSLLPGPRRIAVASAVALLVILAGVRWFDVLSPRYARNMAPTLQGMLGEYIPAEADHGDKAQPEQAAASGSTAGEWANRSIPGAPPKANSMPNAQPIDIGIGRGFSGDVSSFAVSVSRSETLTSSPNVIGVSGALFQQLGLRNNPWIQLVGPAGKTLGVLATRLGNAPTPVVLTQEIHDALSHGRVNLTQVKILPVYWVREGVAESLDFHRPQDLIGEHCEYWYSVGLSLQSLLKLGLTPGSYATLNGPAGSQSVRVQLVDHGSDREIWLSQSVRDAVCAGQTDATVRLLPKS